MTRAAQNKPTSGKKWRFCREYVFGRDCGRAGACYARAYRDPDENGVPPSPVHSDHGSGASLLRRPDVQKQIAEFRRELAESEELTPEGHLRVLRELRDEARDAGDLKSAVKAEEQRGKAAGFYVERHLVQHDHTDKAALAAEARAILEQNPELAQMFAQIIPAGLLEQRDAEVIDVEATESEPAED